MEIYTGIAVGVLAVIIVVVSIVIGCLIKHKCSCCRKKSKDHISTHYTVNKSASITNTNSHKQLIEGEEINEDVDPGDITLKGVVEDELWIDDITGVMHHCIPVLKGCRDTTLKLVTISAEFCSTDSQSHRLEAAAREVTPHIDNVVRLFDSPVDPRLIYSRCSTVVESVLSLINTCRELCDSDLSSDWSDWTTEGMKDINSHLNSLERHSANICQAHPSPACEPKFSIVCEDKESSNSDGHNSRSSSCNTDSGIELHTPPNSVTSWSESQPRGEVPSPVHTVHTVTIERNPSGDSGIISTPQTSSILSTVASQMTNQKADNVGTISIRNPTSVDDSNSVTVLYVEES